MSARRPGFVERSADLAYNRGRRDERARGELIVLALRRGDCWCEMAVGNPMVKSHSEACLDAQAYVEGEL